MSSFVNVQRMIKRKLKRGTKFPSNTTVSGALGKKGDASGELTKFVAPELETMQKRNYTETRATFPFHLRWKFQLAGSRTRGSTIVGVSARSVNVAAKMETRSLFRVVTDEESRRDA